MTDQASLPRSSALSESRLRRLVADELARHEGTTDDEASKQLCDLDRRQLARAILQREIELHAREHLRSGYAPPPEAERHALVERVLAQVFSSVPGLEGFLGMRDAVNIHVQGSRHVVVELLDGAREVHPSPFASDSDVIDMVAHVARRAGTVEKEFNYSHPMLHLTLADGSRLTANAWLGSEPYLTIRRHPLVDQSLADLAERGMFDMGIQSLLAAAVRSRLNILVAGGQGNGKTTLLRACAHEADPDERTLVLEAEPELHLDLFPDRHRHVLTLCERPPNMEGNGGITLADLVWHAKRLTPERILVGEVLGDEVIPMLEAMSQGIRGSMCTMHAESASAVFPRMPVYARSRGREWRSSDVWQLAALALDLIVMVGRDRSGQRVVNEIHYIHRYDEGDRRIISDPWFSADKSSGRAVRSSIIPVHLLDELMAHGYCPDAHDAVVCARP